MGSFYYLFQITVTAYAGCLKHRGRSGDDARRCSSDISLFCCTMDDYLVWFSTLAIDKLFLTHNGCSGLFLFRGCRGRQGLLGGTFSGYVWDFGS